MIKANLDGIPEELKRSDRWVGWKVAERDGKPTKVPVNPKTLNLASATDESTWSTFDEAVSAARQAHLKGVGFVLGVPYAGIDLDHCRDSESGDIEPWAQEIVDSIRSYTEISPSGTGLHLIVRGALPANGRRRTGKIEMYDGGRYFTITGVRVSDTTRVEERQEALDGLYQKTFGGNGRPEATKPIDISLDDQALIERAESATNGAKFSRLLAGQWSGEYDSQSEADLAFCTMLAFWTGRDPGRIDSIFHQSGLMREKWEKRDDYRARTLDAAIAGTTETYQPPGSWSAPRPSTHKPRIQIQNLSDLGNARRFAQLHAQSVRYVTQWGWLVWSRMHFKPDTTGEVQRLAKETVGTIYGEAQKVGEDRRKKVGDYALKSEAKSRIQAMLDLAWSEPEIIASPEQFDRDPWLFNCLNGTIDLKTGKLREHRREDLITKLAPVEFKEHVPGEVFERFLDQIMEGKPQVANYLRRLVGYSLVGSTTEQILPILYGQGSNGKSTFLEVIEEMMGDYAMHTPAATFMVQRGDRILNDIARLQGARLVIATETESAKRLSENLVKSLTGGDSVTARFLYKEYFEFKPQFTPFLMTNHKPLIYGVDHAIWRRVKLIPFTVTIPDKDQDKELPAKLREEMPAILSWAVMGCLEWQDKDKKGLDEPQEVSVSTEAYRSEMDVLGEFLEECCLISKMAETLSKDLYKAYTDWCERSGEKPVSQRWLGLRFSERGFVKGYDGKGLVNWNGIGLKVSKVSHI